MAPRAFRSSSAAGTGAWQIDQLSTPGVYTVTASLRGVLHSSGPDRTGRGGHGDDVTLQMIPGLGTITGRVQNSNGQRLGGVTVTASNGESTLTTTTFTEGDIGFYSLPQLTIPGTYTVQAEVEGFVTESRRVILGATAQSAVDFTMTSTTATLTGRVLSSAGGGIPGAGLIVTTGDLQFRASTSAAPTPAHVHPRPSPAWRLHDHRRTVRARDRHPVPHDRCRQRPTPQVITLERTGGPPPVGTGSLVVNVVNDDPTIDPPGITGTAVTVTRLRSDFSRTIENDDDFSVTFDELPLGTYSVSIDASEEGYNNSAPVRRSIGLGTSEPVTFALQRLGTASGTVINSLEPRGARTHGLHGQAVSPCEHQRPGRRVLQHLPRRERLWDTGERALQTGLWRMEVTSPTGFIVRNDQVIDLSPAVNGRPMVFLVASAEGTSVLPQTVLPVEADPLPNLTGKICRPRLAAGVVDFVALDDNSLAAAGTCNGATVPPASIVISSGSSVPTTLQTPSRCHPPTSPRWCRPVSSPPPARSRSPRPVESRKRTRSPTSMPAMEAPRAIASAWLRW